VPNTWEIRLDIIKAVSRIGVQDHGELLRLRRAELALLRCELEGIAKDLCKLRCDWPLQFQSELRKAGFNPNEPRVPAGHPDGGQWTSESDAAADSEIISDAPDTNWIPGAQYAADGHHWVPKGVYEKEPLQLETRKVFENAKSGPLADNSVNRWNVEHRSYNDAVQEAFNAYLQRNKITSQQMTPDQARQFVDEVLGSPDIRIRGLKMKIMRQMLRYFLLRGPGGGDED
jgi:hypothetical protein